MYVTLLNAATSTSSPTRSIIAIELILVVFYNPRLAFTLIPRRVEVINLIVESFYYEPQEEHDKGVVIVGVEGPQRDIWII